MKPYRFRRSQELYQEACKVLAGGVSSHFRTLGRPHPMFFSEGRGARVRDVDGNEYIDFTLSQGPMLLGHSHPEVLERVRVEQSRGQLFAAQSELEIELARLLTRVLPGVDLVRFSNSGSDAAHAAFRMARALTGKRKILKFEGHYHGWFDDIFLDVKPAEDGSGYRTSLLTGGQPDSVLDQVIVLPWNDLEVIRETLERDPEIAAVVTEPIMCNNSCIVPEPGFLEGLRELCTRHGVVLIFDEVITGFRVALGGAQELLGVQADLSIYGKAMASGFPLSLIAGRRSFMECLADGRVIHAGTMNANIPVLAASLASVEVLRRERSELYPRITRLGRRLMEGLQARARARGLPLLVQGLGPVFHTGFSTRESIRNYRQCAGYDAGLMDEFAYGLLRRGVRIIGRGLWFVSAALTGDDVETVLETAEEVFEEMTRR
ncbi:MAG: aspartate aminotransferase family protein [Candidatus Aminicenantes bacterium]|nr:aspartate aminotransferase family protein [Candidatus Aminicenantes bacterium]